MTDRADDASRSTHRAFLGATAAAFRLWEPVAEPDEGFFSRLAKRFWR